MGNANDLVKQGIEAAREGDKARARELLEQATEIDENNEKAWFWLASVMETDEEKIICLTNVLRLNPGNEKAQTALDKLQTKKRKTKADEEVVPGISRRQLMLYAGGAGVFLVILIAIVAIVVVFSNNQRAEANRQGTEVAQLLLDQQSTQNAINAAESATAFAQVTPSVVGGAATLPPTWTPTPTFTPMGGPAMTALPFPTGMTGTIYGWRGFDTGGQGFMQPATYNLADPPAGPTILDEQLTMRNVRVDPRGNNQLVFTRYFSNSLASGIVVTGLSIGGLALFDMQYPAPEYYQNADQFSFSADGRYAAFVAETLTDSMVDPDGEGVQLFLTDLTVAEVPPTPQGAPTVDPAIPTPTNDPANSPTQRLVNDGATYSWPAISPDGTRIAVVIQSPTGDILGPDIVIFTIGSNTPPVALTNNGDEFVERNLSWSADGNYIMYSAAPANNPTQGDIIIQSSLPGASAIPEFPARNTTSDDIYPIFIMDDQWIAFTSNRSGTYDLFVVNRATGEVFQLTNDRELDYAGGWLP